MTETQIELLKRAWRSTGEIILTDNMTRRIQEIGAMNNLKRMGYVEIRERPRIPGPPEPPMYVITDAGREALNFQH